MKTNRRDVLRLISGAVIGSACSQVSSSKISGEWVDDTAVLDKEPSDEPSEEPSSEDSGEWIDPAEEHVLADEGPVLIDRVPRSLLHGDSSPQELSLHVLSGTLPNDVAGFVFIAHPVPYDDGSAIVVGEGMIQRLSLATHTLTSNVLKPPCYYVDQATEQEDSGFYTAGLARISFILGARSLLNTAFLPMNNRLLITSDAARPWSIDPNTLTLHSPIGTLDEWYNALPNILTTFVNWPFPLTMSTAHPALDPQTNEMFTVNWGVNIGSVFDVGGLGFIHLLVWDGGAMRRFRLKTDWLHLDNVRILQSVHQIAVTSHHVIIMDTAFVSEMSDLIGEEGMKNQKTESILWIVSRSDLVGDDTTVQAQKISIPREAAHFLADYDSADGFITLHLGHQCANDASEMLVEGDLLYDNTPCDASLHGMISATTDMGVLGRYVINTQTGTISDSRYLADERLWGGPALYTFSGNHPPAHFQTIWWLSFGFHPELRLKRVEEAYASYPYRNIPISQLPTTSISPCLIRVDAENLIIEDEYSFPPGRFASSPTFVPKQGVGENEGYIYCVVISDDESTPNSSGDEIWIFDAQNLAQGPLCRLGHPNINLPLTLHSAFLQNIPVGDTYSISVYDDYNAHIAHMDPSIVSLFESEVFTRFT